MSRKYTSILTMEGHTPSGMATHTTRSTVTVDPGKNRAEVEAFVIRHGFTQFRQETGATTDPVVVFLSLEPELP